MKKFGAMLITVMVVLVSCGKEKSVPAETVIDPKPVSAERYEDRVFDPGNFFTPDYTPYEPEPESVAGKMSLSSPKGIAGKVAGIIPGLRKLTEYKTLYNTKRSSFKMPEIKRLESDDNGRKSKKAKADEPFTVADWGPQDAIPAEVHYPSFYVLFSEPVTALSALDEQSGKSEFFSISPAVQGVFRWKGTSLLSFDCTERVNPLQVYTITVSDTVKSLSGKTLSGEKSFSTVAAPLGIIWSAPGYSKSKWVDQNEVSPEFAQEFRVQFNYPIKAESLQSMSVLEFEDSAGGKKSVSFAVKQELADTVTYTWTEKTPFDTYVKLYVTQITGEETNTVSASFHTLSPFVYQYYYDGYTYGKYTNPIRLVFSHPVDVSSAETAIAAVTNEKKDLPVTKDNLEASGQSLTIYGLPVNFHSVYTIRISDALKDVYGRKLTAKDSVIEIPIEVPGPESSARFSDNGVKMLESQFPHRMVFEYQNILANSAYTVRPVDNPYQIYDKPVSVRGSSDAVLLATTPVDERIVEMVDLDPYLKDGKGWIRFDATVALPKKPTKWDESTSYDISNKTSVQVTNLGVSVRYAVNKVVALVTNLSDGKPVEGATVYAFKNRLLLPSQIPSQSLFAKTDKNGLAVIEIPLYKVSEFFPKDNYNPIVLYVEKGDDKVLFEPNDHSPWRSGIYSYEGAKDALTEKTRIFMFCDRGLYKPGETISFRGIDRNQILGSFVPYQGDYTITFEEDTWRNAKVYGTITGTTSESGGFYGSFAIPDDIEPNSYVIRYKRADGKTETLYVTVAFFERLKFQSSVSMPKTPVVAGEKVQGQLHATYLAGGALSSALYESSWFREPWYFTSDAPDFKDYTFGPKDTSENRNHISDGMGLLDANGFATLSCETTGSSIKGSPYRYRLSANVTDVSNQLVATSGATVVHPASYYIGLSRPQISGAFARKGEKVSFTYKLAALDGTAVQGDKEASLLTGSGKKITVRLTREEWNLVQQQGITEIYSRYEKTEVLENEQKIGLSADGKVTVTPQEPGYHKIQLASTDKAGRDVITEYEFFVTGSGQVSWYQEDAETLRLTPDKSQYNPGETAHILLESTLPEGNYLITVEREGIFTEEVRHLDGSINVLDIPVARNYVPVFYVSVSSYSVRQGEPTHQYGEVDLDKPKGYYGAATVFVNPRVKSFTVKVESAKPSYRPGEEAEVTLIATKGGKPLANTELTLLAVDRGVLDLIDYHVPDPIEFFYSTYNFPLRVKGGDSREYLMDPVTYEVKNLRGGDSDDDEKMEERKDFNPTAVFEPMLKTDADGRVTVKFKLPDTLTTYRITAFGVNGELLALQEDEIAVQNPINVQQVLPRELRERDTAELGVLLTNLDGQAHDVTVSLKMRDFDKATSEDATGVTPAEGKAFVDGAAEHTINVPSGANTTVYFDVAAEKAGLVTLEFTIKSDVLNERLVCPLTIKKPYLFETVTTTGQIDADETDAGERIAIPSFADGMQGTVSVTLDATRLGLLGGAVQYLFEYPYGCLEQQSSRVLPLVVFGDYIDVFDLTSEVTNVHKCVTSYFKEWKNCQHSGGGFGYWPSSPWSDMFVSIRIAQIYALALRHGYSKRECAIDIDSLLNYIAQEIEDYNDYFRAYAYYVLALNGRHIPEGKLNALVADERQDISVLALAGLASYAQDDQDTTVAKRAAAKIRTYMRPTARGVDITNPQASHSAYAYYGDESETLALTLQLFTQLDKDDQMNTRLVYSLMQNQRAGYWQNTATTARVLDAIYTVIKTNNLDKTNVDAKALLGDELFAEGKFKVAAAKPVTVTLPFESDLLKKQPKDTELPLQFSKKGKGALYYTATMRYALPEEVQSARDEGLGVVMQLSDNATGEEIKVNSDSPVLELENGKTYKVTITLSSSYDRDFIALRVPVPSGAEILDATFVTSPDMAEGTASGTGAYSDDYDGEAEDLFYGGPITSAVTHYMSNQVIYNNEIQFFWDSFAKGKTTAEFKFRAVRRGVFPVPPANAECMYEPEVFGRTNGALYTIR